MSVKGSLTKRFAPQLARVAPDITHGFVSEALRRAVHGVGPLPPAAVSAARALEDNGGNEEKAIRDLIEVHVRYAGGLVTAAVAIPANVTGLALIQCRMVAAIASLRGYDLADPRVHNAILATVLGEDDVERMVKQRKLPAPPMALATAPAYDPDVDRLISASVASELIARVAGKRLATTIGRRVPVVGGLVGLGVDGFVTWQIGRYADKELLPRARR